MQMSIFGKCYHGCHTLPIHGSGTTHLQDEKSCLPRLRNVLKEKFLMIPHHLAC